MRVTLMMVLVVLVSTVGAGVSLIHLKMTVGGHDIDMISAVGAVIFVGMYAFLATRVSLPWYYVGWFAVPIIGAIAFWRISWRVAYLPWRDWDLRPGETTGPYDLIPSPMAKRREDMVVVRTD
jgi:hypothetical protein